MITQKYLDELTYQIIGAAIEVHKALGPGLLESVYHKCMKEELKLRKLRFASEILTPLKYKGIELNTDLRCDLFVENCIAIELKSIDLLAPIHDAQILTYMRLLNCPKGILINFNCVNLFKEGQKTFVNNLFRVLKEK
ncbi:MAG: GxxExxY protein [Crocinitomicaceae bacterium]|nr:GxxExxY protein [Crocinitomicaceae bacterium]MBK6952372.1 GxxExxY protein [Crocinitomicaceae bacterium]MBK9592197.1 GxxExxY protein [Crocinitomicaceae bacterium]